MTLRRVHPSHGLRILTLSAMVVDCGACASVSGVADSLAEETKTNGQDQIRKGERGAKQGTMPYTLGAVCTPHLPQNSDLPVALGMCPRIVSAGRLRPATWHPPDPTNPTTTHLPTSTTSPSPTTSSPTPFQRRGQQRERMEGSCRLCGEEESGFTEGYRYVRHDSAEV